MNKKTFSWQAFWRGVAGVVVLLLLWEAFARSGLFSEALTPPLAKIAKVGWRLLMDGSLLRNSAYTLGRVMVGLFFACLIGIPLGIAMGRIRTAERFFMPLVSGLMPIPSLAWVPLFVLWFGIGNATTIMVVSYAASFQVIYNVWTGVRAVNPLWVRAAMSMGATRRKLFWCVVLPGALPYVLTGLRLGFGRAWIAVIGGEMLANPSWGLGRVIFDAGEFLESGVMLASLVAIGTIGLIFERLVFQKLEERTVARWGMVAVGTR